MPAALQDAFLIHETCRMTLTEMLDEVPAMLLDDLRMIRQALRKRGVAR